MTDADKTGVEAAHIKSSTDHILEVAVDTADVNDSIRFLKRFRPEGPWVLTAIVPDGRITTTTFTANQIEPMARWIRSRSGHQNLYFTVNSTGDETHHKKPRKTDIRTAEWLHVDVDPAVGEDLAMARTKILERLQNFSPLPHVIVDSGGGYQAFWRIAPSEDLEDVEAMNLALEKRLDGDSCHNIDRIMRLPGTVNLPNEKKRRAGRQTAPAVLVSFEEGLLGTAEIKREKQQSSSQMPMVADEIVPFDPANIRDVMNQNAADRCLHPEKYLVGDSRSENAFSVMQSLLAQELPAPVILGILLCPDLPISDFFLTGQRNPQLYAREQLTKAVAALERRPHWDKTMKEGGFPLPSYNNAREALRVMDVDIWHDMFADRNMISGYPVQDFTGAVTDKALGVLRDAVQQKWRFDPRKEHLRDAFASLAVENRRDPVVDHLDSLRWDGEERLNKWLVTVYGANDTEYVREVGQLMLRAMCRRAREPGIKYDHMVILEGGQGLGKSLSLSILAGDRFSDAGLFSASTDRDRGELLQGNWINEVAELEGMSKRDVEEVKRFVTVRKDEYRAAYAHNKEQRPRRGILVGTTNLQDWNQDPTGARRFLPVECSRVDLDWLSDNRDQLLAESDQRPDTPLVLPQSVWKAAEAEQTRRRSAHSYDTYLEDLTPEVRSGGSERVSTQYIIEDVLGMPPSSLRDRKMTTIIGERMRLLGWDGPKTVVIHDGARRTGYRRATDLPDLLEPPF